MKQDTQTLLTDWKQRNPHCQWAVDAKDALIGYRIDPSAEFYPVASRAITGQWVLLPYEILGNGKRMIDFTPGNYWVPA